LAPAVQPAGAMSKTQTPSMPTAESQSALFSMRPAQPDDETFLFRLFGETQDHLVSIRPNQQLWSMLIDMQYRGRKSSYSQQYPAAEDTILCRDNQPVGRLLVNHEQDCLRIIDIAVLAELRGQGLGAWSLRRCQQQAADAGKRVDLSVNPINPARLLYEHLGFRAMNDDLMNLEMTWNPAQLS
jgi:ribosomal protein S18 acetylase RimI-like enzyme